MNREVTKWKCLYQDVVSTQLQILFRLTEL